MMNPIMTYRVPCALTDHCWRLANKANVMYYEVERAVKLVDAVLRTLCDRSLTILRGREHLSLQNVSDCPIAQHTNPNP